MSTTSLLFLFFFTFQSVVFSAVWYVNPNGSDSSNCATPATACATIYHVLLLDTTTNPVTVYLSPGTFTGSFSMYYGDATIIGSGQDVSVINVANGGIGNFNNNWVFANLTINGYTSGGTGTIFDIFNVNSLNGGCPQGCSGLFSFVTIRDLNLGNFLRWDGHAGNLTFQDSLVTNITFANSGLLYIAINNFQGTAYLNIVRTSFVNNTGGLVGLFDLNTYLGGPVVANIINSSISYNVGGSNSLGAVNGDSNGPTITLTANNSLFLGNQYTYGGAFRETTYGPVAFTLNNCAVCGNSGVIYIQGSQGTFTVNGGYSQGSYLGVQSCSAFGGSLFVTPTTAVATTAIPTTAIPTTALPTTAVSTTAVPTTAVSHRH